jgi:chemotaxis protein MotB
MLRVRERTNSWPSFVDLFSNLVIVLIFLLIVFVFLWTSTSVFNKGSGIAKVAELKKITAEQTQKITLLEQSEQEAKNLLLTARDKLLEIDKQKSDIESAKNELENANSSLSYEKDALLSENDRLAQEQELLAQEKEQLAAERNQLAADQVEVISVYEKKLYDLQSQQKQMDSLVQILRAQLGDAKAQSMNAQEIQQRAAGLQSEIERLNGALAAAEQNRATSQAEYTAMSQRLNKALADRIADQAAMSKYQSQFFGAIRDALAGFGGVDVSSDRFVISSDILFPLGGFTLSPEGKNQIKILAKVISQMETKIPANVMWVIRVDGHTDRLPVNKDAKSYKNNLELSLLRAKSVVKELEQHGVNSRRLVPAGFGDKYPIVEGKNAKDLQKNRRIELRLTNP